MSQPGLPSSKPPRRHSAPVMHGRVSAGPARALPSSDPFGDLPVLRLDRARTNLPSPISTFIGRQKETGTLATLVTGSRLVTVTGAPGVGKSRLALETASRVADAYADGVRWIDLRSAKDNRALIAATADALLEGKGLEDMSRLRDLLRGRRILVVFDNCTHLADDCARLVKDLLEGSPQLSVMVTSLRPLRIKGEQIFRLGPMQNPPPGERRGSAATVRKLAECESVALLADRAQKIDPGFRLDRTNTSAVSDICRLVDGVPLALENAAENLSVLTADELAERLHRSPALALGQAAPGSLQQRLADSYGFLDESEALLLSRLSVFEAGWTLKGAEAVCSGGHLPAEQILSLLRSLAEKSLVEVDRFGGEARYRLLSPIRAFLRGKLDGRAASRLQKLLAQWLASFAERAEAELRGRFHAQWINRIDAELENLQDALEVGADGDPERQLRIAASLATFWMTRSEFEYARAVIADAIHVASDAPPALRAKAILTAGLLAAKQSDFEEALASAEEGLRISQQLSDSGLTAKAMTLMGSVSASFQGPRGSLAILHEAFSKAKDAQDLVLMTDALLELGRVHMLATNREAAAACLREALEISTQRGDRRGEVEATLGLGWIALEKDDLPSAAVHFERAMRGSRAIGDRLSEAESRCFLGDTLRRTNDFPVARRHLQKALALGRSIKAPFVEARALAGLARLSEAEGDGAQARQLFEKVLSLTQAHRLSYIQVRALHALAAVLKSTGDLHGSKALLEEAVTVAREAGDEPGLATSLFILARHLKMEGDHDRAAAVHHESLELRRRSQDTSALADSLEALAGMMANTRRQAAARLLGAAGSLRDARHVQTSGCPCCRHDVEMVSKGLSSDELEAALAEGASLSSEEAIAYATRGRGVRGRPSFGWESLTPTELKVAMLVGEGLTNPEIGDRMFISKRTVGAHLGRIFDKLGINSRSQLAREVARQDVLEKSGPPPALR